MKGFLFLLLAIIFLLTIQIQTGVLGNQTFAIGYDPDIVTGTATARLKPVKGGVLALSGMDRGSFLLFLTNTLIHLFYHN